MNNKSVVQESIFTIIKQNPKFHQSRSTDWFRQKIKELGSNYNPESRDQLIAQTKQLQTTVLLPSTLLFFKYDPKFKETLPYYDKFPLSFIFSIDKTSFTGINFHYLTQPMRIKLYDAMYRIASVTGNNKQQALQLNWNLLSNVSKFPGASVSVKKYLFSHVVSKFIKVPIEDWKTAIMLENADFKKMSGTNVRTITSRLAADALKAIKQK